MDIQRVGSLEEQKMIGGDLAVKEPARMVIAILAKIPNPKSQFSIKSSAFAKATMDRQIPNSSIQKDFIYNFIKRFYSQNEFEALYNQLEQNFNCQKTTSTSRILDAVSVLLGFAGNERKYKHEAVKKLEENSAMPYLLKPTIIHSVVASDQRERSNLLRMPASPPASTQSNRGESLGGQDLNLKQLDRLLCRSAPRNDKQWILQTTPLFEYLVKNIHRDKKRLAATTQLYIAKGLRNIVKKNIQYPISNIHPVFAAGGMSNNKIISVYLEKQGVYLSKKIPRGDEGIAVGQIIYYLLNNN